jgi:hypothetical protein
MQTATRRRFSQPDSRADAGRHGPASLRDEREPAKAAYLAAVRDAMAWA